MPSVMQCIIFCATRKENVKLPIKLWDIVNSMTHSDFKDVKT